MIESRVMPGKMVPANGAVVSSYFSPFLKTKKMFIAPTSSTKELVAASSHKALKKR